MKIFKIVAVLLVLVFMFLELVIFSTDTKKELTKPLVSVSTFSLYDITKHIAGESIEIVNILPFGVDPHSFGLTPKIMAKIEKSTLVFYSGAGLEPWIDKIAFAKAPIDISKFVNLLQLEHDEDEHHHDEHCGHGAQDPHYWLDFTNMQKMTKVISDELIKILPANKEIYEKNRDAYIKMLQDLDMQYKTQLHSCQV
ncbi:MAG: metal ABC transporter substrate-binding protein, partial [Sulfurimonas sp.]|nr:metal ABC transporter substrate-binding protein [Sulfurimonas sp.]